jgi:uncharacterized protein (DUF983 family)
MTDTVVAPRRPVLLGMKRGLAYKCPECGKGRLFGKYLKVNPTCEACGYDLSQHRADDGPAYLTILLVGHLVIAPMLFFPIVWEASPLVVMPLALTAITVITLAALPRIKGAFVGLLWAVRPGQHQH